MLGLVLALLGVGLTVVTGNGVFDGIATLGIGALLVTVAVVLATEINSLLIGESALPEEMTRIHRALESTPGIERVIHLRTVHLGPDELLVASKIGIPADADGADLAATVDDAERRIRAALPSAKMIYLESDVYRPRPAPS